MSNCVGCSPAATPLCKNAHYRLPSGIEFLYRYSYLSHAAGAMVVIDVITADAPLERKILTYKEWETFSEGAFPKPSTE